MFYQHNYLQKYIFFQYGVIIAVFFILKQPRNIIVFICVIKLCSKNIMFYQHNFSAIINISPASSTL